MEGEKKVRGERRRKNEVEGWKKSGRKLERGRKTCEEKKKNVAKKHERERKK